MANSLIDNGYSASVYNQYSGRGMYGNTCMGIVGDRDAIYTVCDNHNFRYGNTDNLGYDTIMYWQGIEWDGIKWENHEEDDYE